MGRNPHQLSHDGPLIPSHPAEPGSPSDPRPQAGRNSDDTIALTPQWALRSTATAPIDQGCPPSLHAAPNSVPLSSSTLTPAPSGATGDSVLEPTTRCLLKSTPRCLFPNENRLLGLKALETTMPDPMEWQSALRALPTRRDFETFSDKFEAFAARIEMVLHSELAAVRSSISSLSQKVIAVESGSQALESRIAALEQFRSESI